MISLLINSRHAEYSISFQFKHDNSLQNVFILFLQKAKRTLSLIFFINQSYVNKAFI